MSNSGGLLQMITTGKQDIYLTHKPQITFFKKVYKKYTNFSLELREIISLQQQQYNSNISFKLNSGDLIHRCYLEVELPLLSFSDNYITNINYIEYKQFILNKLNSKKIKYQTLFTNLFSYSNLELELYRNLCNSLNTSNITISVLKNIVNIFNYKNKDNLDLYISNIDNNLFTLIDISSYINNINYLINENNKINIINELNERYNKMLLYLRYYNYFIIKYTNLINEKTKLNQINFSFAEYLGHNYFQNFTIEIGGYQIDTYDNDYLHITQLHRIKNDELNNYLDMIGHTPDLYTFNTDIKGNTKILIPLIFWFNKDAGLSLPIISLQYSDIIITVKTHQLNNIISFENYDDLFNNLLIITIDSEPNNIIFNRKLIYNDYIINEFNIVYNCIYINNELLLLQFPNLLKEDRFFILSKYGTKDLNLHDKFKNLLIDDINIDTYYINIYQWIYFMKDLKNNINIANKLGFYYPFTNFNIYYGLINNPKIKLITEIVYLDDIEREKFSNNKLEYLIETIDTDIYNYDKDILSYNFNLSFTKPIKNIIWYIQPQIYYNFFNNNGKNKSLIYNNNYLSEHNIITTQQIIFNNYDVLLNTSIIDDNYYTYLLSYKLLNNILVSGIYYHSFCLYPEETQPSGTVNLNYIKGAIINININNNFINDYNQILTQLNESIKTNFIMKVMAKNYQLLIIHKGQANFLFV